MAHDSLQRGPAHLDRVVLEEASARARGRVEAGDGEDGSAGHRGHGINPVEGSTGGEGQVNLLPGCQAVIGTGDSEKGAGLIIGPDGDTWRVDHERSWAGHDQVLVDLSGRRR